MSEIDTITSTAHNALDEWATFVRGGVRIGFANAAIEHKFFFGGGTAEPDWPDDVQTVERAVLLLPELERDAIKLFYVRKRHIQNIAKHMECSSAKVDTLLKSGRRFVGGFITATNAA